MADQNTHYDILIIGQGASSYAAAMYAARYQMKPIIFGAIFGGETATGGTIENYPGYPEIDGFELMMKFREQAEKYDVPIVDENIIKAEKLDDGFQVKTEAGETYHGTSIMLGVGRERRTLGLEHETEWMGRGVSYCATCDAPLHRGNTVAVVGGGDSAIKGAVLLGKYAETVYIVYRQDRFTRPEPINLAQLDASENVHPIFNAQIVELIGDNGLTGIVLNLDFEGSNRLTVDGVFIEIGADPRVELPNQLGLTLNENNEVIVDKSGATNIEGVFAAGDLTDASGDLKQTITAAAQGAVAATSAYEYVSQHSNACETHAMGFSLVS
jgi:thioredoxin reductase (NADPH)